MEPINWTELGVGGVIAFLIVRETFNFALNWRKSQNGNDPMREAAKTFQESTEFLKELRNGVGDVKSTTNKIKEDTTVIRDRVERK